MTERKMSDDSGRLTAFQPQTYICWGVGGEVGVGGLIEVCTKHGLRMGNH